MIEFIVVLLATQAMIVILVGSIEVLLRLSPVAFELLIAIQEIKQKLKELEGMLHETH